MKDPRLLAVEIAAAYLKEVPDKMIKGLDLRYVSSEVQRVVYSFLPLEELEANGMLEGIERIGEDLRGAWLQARGSCRSPNDFLNAARIRFASIIFSGLRKRIGREKRIYSGTDCFWGTILRSEGFDGLKALLIDARDRYDIVTNLDVRGRVAFAILPPMRFDKFVSEGMLIEAEGQGDPGEPAKPTERGKGAIESVLREEAGKLNIKL